MEIIRIYADVDETLVLGEEGVPNFELIGAINWYKVANGGYTETRVWSDDVTRGVVILCDYAIDADGIPCAKDPALPEPGDIVIDDTREVYLCQHEPGASCKEAPDVEGYHFVFSIDAGTLPDGVRAYTSEQFIEFVRTGKRL